MSFEGRWEQRWHPLRREWVVYSAHRNARPWSSGQAEAPPTDAPAHDPDCYLCPGNSRVSGSRNPDYRGVFAFDNDHPVVGPLAPEVLDQQDGLYRRSSAKGRARVLCYDHRHHVTLNDLDLSGAEAVLRAWQAETLALAQDPALAYALIFENRGRLCGVSNPHPHCQIYATSFVFKHVEQELEAVAQRQAQGGDLFAEILEAEAAGPRIVCENAYAVAFIPFFARYAYEVWVFPKRRHATLATLAEEELRGLAELYQDLGRRYDLLYGQPFPYVMSLYQAPLRGAYPDYHLHFVFLPPLRQPGLQKFLAGPEIGGGNFMADTLPEEKAQELRGLDPSLYKVRL